MYVNYYCNNKKQHIMFIIFSQLTSEVLHAQKICWKQNMTNSRPTTDEHIDLNVTFISNTDTCSVQLNTRKGSSNRVNLSASCSHTFIITVESLSHVKFSRRLCCKLYSSVCFSESETLCISWVLSQQDWTYCRDNTAHINSEALIMITPG